VQCEVKVLEEKVVVHEAIKKNDNPLLESGRMSAARSLEAAEELLNDLSRSDDGGKVYEDASKYRVTLRRVFAPQAEPWTGEVTGQVNFFPMNTVDLLVAGKSLQVFDKNNKKRWESALTYTISDAFAEHGDGRFAPAVEHDGTLYFCDQGMLTAFDLDSGEVRWRVTSVWISRVVPDGEGSLYVSTTTAAPEDIQYSKQVKIFERIEPILMKVDADTGEVKWKVPRAGDECFISGKYVYGARSTSSILSMFDPDGDMTVQFFLNRINPRNGKVIWTYEQPRMPEHMDFQGKNILLQFSDELQVLHYLAL
jgi:outer membrane protein assembly factor BamB